MEALATSPTMDKEGTAPAREAPAKSAAQKVVDALQNPEYTWRTLDGIARETGLAASEILPILESTLADRVVRSSIRDENGRALYATRERYKRQRSFVSSVLTALSDQIR